MLLRQGPGDLAGGPGKSALHGVFAKPGKKAGEIYMWSKAQEKVLDISSHQGNGNQNHSEIPLHTYLMALIKKAGKDRRWQGRGEAGTLIHR